MKNTITLFPTTLGMSLDFNVFNSCEYKWFLERCCHYYKHSYNTDLIAGSEFAKAMEVTRTAYYKLNLTAEEAVELGKRSLLEEYGATYALENYPDVLKTPEKMAEVFTRMFLENPLDATNTLPFLMEDGTLSVEQKFTVELPFKHPETGLPILFEGTLDMLGMRDGILYAEDEKTCKSVLTEHNKQADLLRTQKEVAYVILANKNKERFGGQKVSHIRINRCKIKRSYTKNESTVETYEFVVDEWFQETYWNNLLYQVSNMLEKYHKFNALQLAWKNNPTYETNQVIFPRAYGYSCTSFFRPCVFTYHCTSGNAQNLEEQGFKQVVCNNATKGREVTLNNYRKHLFDPHVELVTEVKEDTDEYYNGGY